MSGYFSVHCQAVAATLGLQSWGCVKNAVVPLMPFCLVLKMSETQGDKKEYLYIKDPQVHNLLGGKHQRCIPCVMCVQFL